MMTDTTVLSVYNKGETPKLYATITTLNTDGTVTTNTEYDTGFTGRNGYYPLEVVMLSSTTAFCIYTASGSPFHLFGFIITVSGTSLTFGSAADSGFVPTAGGSPVDTTLCALSSTSVAVASGTSSTSSRVIKATVSGTTVTWETATTISCQGITHMGALSSSIALIHYVSSSTNYQATLRVVDFSTNPPTLGTAKTMSAVTASNANRGIILPVNSTTAYASLSNQSENVTIKVTISGTTIDTNLQRLNGIYQLVGGGVDQRGYTAAITTNGNILSAIYSDGSSVYSFQPSLFNSQLMTMDDATSNSWRGLKYDYYGRYRNDALGSSAEEIANNKLHLVRVGSTNKFVCGSWTEDSSSSRKAAIRIIEVIE